MHKSVSIPEELVFKTMDEVYVRTARNPEKPTKFSQIVVEALKLYFKLKSTEVSVCKS